MTASGAETPPGDAWDPVRRGLLRLAKTWIVLTAVSVAVQLATTHAEAAVRAGDAGAQHRVVLATLLAVLFQIFYLPVGVLLSWDAVRLARAPASSSAVLPARVAAAGFAATVLLGAVLLIGATGEGAGDSARPLALALGGARFAALVGLALALIQLARARALAPSPQGAGALIALCVLDAGLPLWRVLTGAALLAGQSPWLSRFVLLAVQISLAALIVSSARRVARNLPGAPAEGEREADGARAAEPPTKEAPERDSDPDQQQHRSNRARNGDASHERTAERARSEKSLPELGLPVGQAVIIALLATLGGATLPAWDAVRDDRLIKALLDRFAEPGAASPAGLGFAFVGSLLLGVILARVLSQDVYRARLAFAGLLLVGGGYTMVTAHDMATARSREINAWAVCGTGLTATGEQALPHVAPRDVAGPLDETGRGCVTLGEHRDQYAERHPRGELRDGAVQIWSRFHGDRVRFFGGTLASLLLFLLSGVALVRAPATLENGRNSAS